MNKFLSYANISNNHVDLPLGTTSFALAIVYSQWIIPDQFSATLDGADISDLLTPAPDSSKVVTIRLQPGRNVLKLSVEGYVPSRTARDADQIVFLVEGG